MIVAQVGLIFLPTLVFVWLTRQSAHEILKLQRLDFWSGVTCFLLGLACWPVFILFSTLTQLLMALISPVSASGSTTVVNQGGAPWIAFVGVALLGPLCEELLFRGVLLSTYERRFARHAIWLVGILFAFLHPSLDQALGALFLGIVAGWVVFRTRSIWSGVLLHVGVNLVAALLALLLSQTVSGGLEGAAVAEAGDLTSVLLTAVLVWGVFGLIMLVPGFFLMRSLAKRNPAPIWPEARLSLGALWPYTLVVIGVVAFSIVRLLQGSS